MRTLMYLHVSMLLILSLSPAGETARTSEKPAEVGSIRVVIRLNKDTPLLQGRVMVMPSSPNRRNEEPKEATADIDGYYRISGLLPGEYRVTASVPGYTTTKKTAKVEKYKLTHIKIEVKKKPQK